MGYVVLILTTNDLYTKLPTGIVRLPYAYHNMFKIATRMPSSIIEYSPTATTLDIRFIASRAAPAIAAAVTTVSI